ncbi:type 1 glutamine amidotransferase domain-containing protein [bacterium]|nr:MAG: type 1 glutamine amidotransferase domain-containing protein [bacterium]
MGSKGTVLIAASGAKALELSGGRTVPTGFYLDELSVPALTLIDAGYEIALATPNGVAPAMDARSEKVSRFGGDPEKLRRALAFVRAHPSVLKPLGFGEAASGRLESFAALFIPGGHGPMADLMTDPELGKILRHFHETGKPTASLCHGPVALLAALKRAADYRRALASGDAEAAKKASSGWQYADYRMTVYSTEEEKSVEKNVFGGRLPFYAADALSGAGGLVENGPPRKPFTVRDRELITGQNPASGQALADALLGALRGKEGAVHA